jgi:hypothetical protein
MQVLHPTLHGYPHRLPGQGTCSDAMIIGDWLLVRDRVKIIDDWLLVRVGLRH